MTTYKFEFCENPNDVEQEYGPGIYHVITVEAKDLETANEMSEKLFTRKTGIRRITEEMCCGYWIVKSK